MTNLAFLDEAVCDWIESHWKNGSTLSFVSDGLCGLHHFEPFTKRQIPGAWKLFKTWRKLEAPSRAPPLTQPIVYALAHYAVLHHDLALGAAILLGFFALLRTSEILTVQVSDLLFFQNRGIVRLPCTKTGQRHAAGETVAFDDWFTLDVLKELCILRRHQLGPEAPLWLLSPQTFRYRFNHLLHRLGLISHGFRPYSLRRGGATFLFQQTGSMEVALLKGRWNSPQVAKVYIMDGLSHVPNMTFSPGARRKLTKFHPLNHKF